MRVLVTGATGFVGPFVVQALDASGCSVVAATRRACHVPRVAELQVVENIGPSTDWSAALRDVMAVVHLAARVHVMEEHSADPMAEFRRVNTAGTLRLAECAADAGVRRFVYVSTIKVNGDETRLHAFRESDPPAPADPYALSKLEAERGLRAIEARSAMSVAILRPPLVYGPNVGGNFLRLLHAVWRGWPLPFSLVRNSRSLVFVRNLAELLARCTHDPRAAGQTFLVADGEDVSTPELIRKIARALDVSPQLVPIPVPILRAGARLVGAVAPMDRLCGDLQVDTSYVRQQLDWKSPFKLREGFACTAEWYRATHGGGDPASRLR